MTFQAASEQPSPIEILAQLDRIIASPEFCVPERNRSFLRYVVVEAVAGRAASLKAYCIAIEVFARAETFDAQNDPVVRIEAARLRRALERYYLVAGRDDEILIDIPKGAYRPTFTVRRHLRFVTPVTAPVEAVVEKVATNTRRKGILSFFSMSPLW